MYRQILLSTLFLGTPVIESMAMDTEELTPSGSQIPTLERKLERKRGEWDLGLMIQTGNCPTPLKEDEIVTLFSAPFVSKSEARETMGPVAIRGMRAAIKEPRDTVEKIQAFLKDRTKADDINALLIDEVKRPIATTKANIKVLGTYKLRLGSVEKYEFKVAFSSIDPQN